MKLLIFWLVCNSRRLMCTFCLALTLKTQHLEFGSHLMFDYTKDHIKGVTVGVSQPVHTLQAALIAHPKQGWELSLQRTWQIVTWPCEIPLSPCRKQPAGGSMAQAQGNFPWWTQGPSVPSSLNLQESEIKILTCWQVILIKTSNTTGHVCVASANHLRARSRLQTSALIGYLYSWPDGPQLEEWAEWKCSPPLITLPWYQATQ